MRNDGRAYNETRQIKFSPNYTKNALASVLAEFGDTKVIVTATNDEKKPKWMEKEDMRGWVTAEYSLLPTSTSTRCMSMWPGRHMSPTRTVTGIPAPPAASR